DHAGQAVDGGPAPGQLALVGAAEQQPGHETAGVGDGPVAQVGDVDVAHQGDVAVQLDEGQQVQQAGDVAAEGEEHQGGLDAGVGERPGGEGGGTGEEGLDGGSGEGDVDALAALRQAPGVGDVAEERRHQVEEHDPDAGRFAAVADQRGGVAEFVDRGADDEPGQDAQVGQRRQRAGQ